jgi:hypothetical protein
VDIRKIFPATVPVPRGFPESVSQPLGGNLKMKTRLLIAASVMALAASFAGPTIAQDQNLTINGAPVPADQLDAVKAKCDELLANRATGLAQPGQGQDPSALPADPAAPAADANAAVAEATPAPAANGDAAAAVGAPIDLETLTADICETGGFKPAAGM